MPKDTIFNADHQPAGFTFDNRVAEVFDDMLNRSVPFYRQVIEMIAGLLAESLSPGDTVYEGQVVGENCRDTDLLANVCRRKNLTNVRSANKDTTVTLKAPRLMSMEVALEYIEDDELVELTPNSIRIRKRQLREADRKRTNRAKKG